MNRSRNSYDMVMSAWLAMLQAKGISMNSLLVYRCALTNLRQFLFSQRIYRPDEVAVDHLLLWQHHLDSTNCTLSTLESFTLAVRRWFAWQADTGQLFQSPANLLRAPKVPPPNTRCPSEKEMRHLLESIVGRDPLVLRDRAILETAYATGARLAELAGLSITSLDLNGHMVRLHGKGHRDRIVPLTRAAVGALQGYIHNGRTRFPQSIDDSTVLFLGIRGRLSRIGISRMVESRAARIGLTLTPHDIRRACATHMLEGGAHPSAIAAMLGHRGYKHLRSYLKISPEAAINAIRTTLILQ